MHNNKKKIILVIDVQKNIIGDDRNFRFIKYKNKKLIRNINEHVEINKEQDVIFIKHTLFKTLIFNNFIPSTKFATGLKVNNNIYSKNKFNALSNEKLLEHLLKSNITTIEILGVDLCCCIKKTILNLLKYNFKINIIEKCCDTLFQRKWTILKKTLLKKGVNIL